MGKPVFYISGQSTALDYAKAYLTKWNCPVSDIPDQSVTHLLLPVPCFQPEDAATILTDLPPDVTILGGNLQSPVFHRFNCLDLLQDPWYLSENAAITAHGAIQVAMEKSTITLADCPVLVVGWGRIGKCLADLLKQMGAKVTISTREESNRSILTCLGYDTLSLEPPYYSLLRYRLIFNTAPVCLLTREILENCAPDCIKIDLASVRGIEGDDVIWARGLPGKLFPESSGELIARTALRLVKN